MTRGILAEARQLFDSSMRFYNSDGTIKYETNESQFGWQCSDFVIDENVLFCEVINKNVRKASIRDDVKVEVEDSIKFRENLAEACDTKTVENKCQKDIVNTASGKMRFYTSKGTIKHETNESQFGWKCSDFVIDENKSFCEVINNYVRKVSIHSDIEEEVEEDINIRYKEGSLTVYQSKVREYFAETCDTKILDDRATEDVREKKFINIHSAVPSKDQLWELVNANNFESRMLLSVIHNAKFEKLQKSSPTVYSPYKKLTLACELRNCKAVCYLLKDNQNEYSKLVKKVSERNCYVHGENNLLSLMVELTLTDTPYRIEEILIKEDIFKRKRLNNGVNDNQTVTNYPYSRGIIPYFQEDNRVTTDHVGLDYFNKTTCEMHAEIAGIKKGFQVRFICTVASSTAIITGKNIHVLAEIIELI